jgi:hypothetical protein
MAVTTGEPQRCKVILEGWRPGVAAAILADPSPNAMRTGFDELAALLASLVDDPDAVRLVIPVDVAAAVKRRDPKTSYTVARGSGTVGGRTMARADGGFDVILWGDALCQVDGSSRLKLTARGQPSVNPEGLRLLSHTIAHEAQHVVMDGRGSGFEAYGYEKISGAARRLMFAVATKMCDEHRAEWNAAQVTGNDPPTVGDVLDVLCHMGNDLAVANSRFQNSQTAPIDIQRFRDDVYSACAPFWTSVSYWAAYYRAGDDVTDVPQEIGELNIWDRYVGGTWRSMAQALSQLPVDLTTSPDVLQRAAKEVAIAVDDSLNYTGFRHFDTPTAEHFYVDRQDFPSARA